MPDLRPSVETLPTYPAEALYAQRAALEQRGLRVFDFSVGDPLEPTDERVRSAFVAAVPKVSQYPPVRGTRAFREACARWLQTRFGVVMDPDTEILPCSGAKEAVFHLPLVFLAPQRRPRLLYGVPAYAVYGRSASFAGGIPWPVEMMPQHGYQLRPWDLPADAIAETGIIWINYPQNPTGATVDVDYLRQVLRFAQQHDILLASDECYADFYFDSPPASLLQVGRRGALAFHSLSKRSGMTGYRSGFIAGDADLIATLARARANFGTASPLPVQCAAIAAWDDTTHVEARRELFRRKRDLFRDFFARHSISHHRCDATLYLWVEVPTGDPSTYAKLLADHGLLVSPATQFGVDQPYIRLALVPTLEDCRAAIEVWAAISKQT